MISNIFKLGLLASIATIAIATPAQAQYALGVQNTINTETGNKWTRGTIKINEKSTVKRLTDTVSKSQALKVEAFPNGFAVIDFDGSNFTGHAFATNVDVDIVDPAALGAYSQSTTRDRISTVTNTNTQGVINSGSNGTYNNSFIDAKTYLD